MPDSPSASSLVSLLPPAPSLVFTGIWLELSQLQSLLAQSPNPVPISLTAEAKSSLLPSRPHKTGHCSFCPQPQPLPFAPSQQSSNTSGLALPPGLCTGGSLCLTLFPKRPQAPTPTPFKSLFKCHLQGCRADSGTLIPFSLLSFWLSTLTVT